MEISVTVMQLPPFLNITGIWWHSQTEVQNVYMWLGASICTKSKYFTSFWYASVSICENGPLIRNWISSSWSLISGTQTIHLYITCFDFYIMQSYLLFYYSSTTESGGYQFYLFPKIQFGYCHWVHKSSIHTGTALISGYNFTHVYCSIYIADTLHITEHKEVMLKNIQTCWRLLWSILNMS